MLARILGFFVLWVIFSRHTAADFAVGLMAAWGAAAVSLRLLPPADWQLRGLPFAMLIPGFLWQSCCAAIDVAKLALHPRVPVHPGFVSCHHVATAGPKRDAFNLVTSLLPGSVPCGRNAAGTPVLHCLITDPAVATRLAGDEARFLRAFGESRNA